jgi:nucleoside-diphosphate-sugar epimerase
VEIVAGDMTDKDSLEKAAHGADVIYHLAAVINPSDEEKMRAVNVDGTANLLSYSQAKKFIYMSSTSAMGRKLAERPANEFTECRPSSLYGRTKLEAEQLVIANGGMALRAADIYGPGFEEGYFYVFRKLEEGKMPIIGNGKNNLQYVHVKDVAQALLLAKDKGKAGEVYIITGREGWTQRQLFDYSAKLLGAEPPRKHVAVWLAKAMAKLKGKADMADIIDKIAADRSFSIDKAMRELDYEPKVDYEHGLAEMIREYRSKARQ